MPGPIKVTSARDGKAESIPWGHIPTGVSWERIELDRAPATPAEQVWLRDQILVRLAPGGVVTTATDDDQAQATTDEPTPVVRLSVNLAPSVAAALKSTADAQHITVTEATRRAIGLLKLADDARVQGHRLVIVEGTGPSATQREIVLL